MDIKGRLVYIMLGSGVDGEETLLSAPVSVESGMGVVAFLRLGKGLFYNDCTLRSVFNYFIQPL